MKKIITYGAVYLIFATSSCKKEDHLTPTPAGPAVAAVETAAPLTAKFEFTVQDPINIFENQTIQFKNLSTGYKTCSWEFGNSTKSQEASPAISYPMHGYYPVKLTVFDANGNRQTFIQDINILCLYYNGIHPTPPLAGG